MGIFNRLKNLSKSQKSKEITQRDNLFDLCPGDIVSIDYQDHIVDAKIQYKDGRWTWTEYKIIDGTEVSWLSVEMDDSLELSLYKDITPFTTEAFKETEYNGKKYFLEEGSDAIVNHVSGNIGLEKGCKFEYFEYATADGKDLLSVEIYDGSFEMSTGITLEEFQVNVYKKKIER